MKNYSGLKLDELSFYNALALRRGMLSGCGTRIWDWPEDDAGYEGCAWGYLELTESGAVEQFNFVDDAEYPGSYHDDDPADISEYRVAVEALLAKATIDRPLCQLSGMLIIERTQAALDVELARHGC